MSDCCVVLFCYRQIRKLINIYGTSTNIELQQRSVEYTSLFAKHDSMRWVLCNCCSVQDCGWYMCMEQNFVISIPDVISCTWNSMWLVGGLKSLQKNSVYWQENDHLPTVAPTRKGSAILKRQPVRLLPASDFWRNIHESVDVWHAHWIISFSFLCMVCCTSSMSLLMHWAYVSKAIQFKSVQGRSWKKFALTFRRLLLNLCFLNILICSDFCSNLGMH